MQRGFSLVELSIVLVILGLLTGGILAGQSLIRAAELRSISTDLSRYHTAINTFRDKYFAFPGDFGKATDFFGIRTGSASTTGSDTACVSVLTSTTGTCNGVQDGLLNNNTAQWPSQPLSERYLFWQHLALAGLIEGSYTGAYTTAGYTNRPPAKAANGQWSATYLDPGFTGGMIGGNFVGNIITAVSGSNYQLMSPEETWNVDTKLDDGRPGTGMVFVDQMSATTMPNCATTNNASDSVYSLSNPAKLCSPRLKL